MPEKVLIVDDDADTINFMKQILTRQGFQTIIAWNGVEALEQAHMEKPDLIILDVMMPGMDGYEVARSLRRHPDTSTIPILMFTAKAQLQDKVEGYEAGVDIYLTKPVHPIELQANIKTLLMKKIAREEELSDKGYVVGVMAAKGGLGVSTLALNLAITYQRKMNAKVIAAEMKPGQGSWAQEMGIVSPYGTANLLRLDAVELTQDVVERELVNTTYGVRLLLASNQSKDVGTATAVSNYDAMIDLLAEEADLIILDIGTNFHPAYDQIIAKCDEVIFITEPMPVAVKRSKVLIDELREMSFGSAKVLTVVMINHSRSDLTLSVTQVENLLGQSVALGIPPATEQSFHSGERSIPFALVQPEGIVANQFGVLADQINRRIKAK